jgi:23S rRNA pseudouridine955/2504/2580 synthase
MRQLCGDRCCRLARVEIEVAYEDDWLLVVVKPSGMAVHASRDVDTDLFTLVREGRPYAALLHRLDREASGLLLLSKSRDVNAALQRELEAHRIDRAYTALVAGRLIEPVTASRPIAVRGLGRGAVRRPPPHDAKPAKSHFAPVRRVGPHTLVEVMLETGRKHQIRFHAATLGHPIVGDRRFGGPDAARLALHAHRLAFRHPMTERRLTLEAELPADFRGLIAEAARARPPRRQRS